MSFPGRTSLSSSEYLTVRGLRYHVRRWSVADDRPTPRPTLFLLHGWLDTSATFEDMVAALLPDWQVLSPDWRGFGLTEWPQDGYWFPDYLADLDALLAHYAPEGAVTLIGHSLGAQVASIYSGVRPARVERLVVLDGLFMRDDEPERSPDRIGSWLDQLRKPLSDPSYDSYEQLASRIRRLHSRITPERALMVAHGWGRIREDGRIGLCADPKHRLLFPTSYRLAESKAAWSRITARTLFVDGGRSELRARLTAEDIASRRACFRDRQETVIEDCAHMLHFEAPEQTARLIRQFLEA